MLGASLLAAAHRADAAVQGSGLLRTRPLVMLLVAGTVRMNRAWLMGLEHRRTLTSTVPPACDSIRSRPPLDDLSQPEMLFVPPNRLCAQP